MGTLKTYREDEAACLVTFTLDAEACGSAKAVSLVGEFNGWDWAATPMERAEDGSFSVALDVPCGRSYQYRYLLDGSRWENDWYADRYVPAPYGGDNCVVDVEPRA